MKEEAAKIKREKSPLYPAVSIKDCVEFIKVIDSLGGKVVSYKTLLEAMGLSNRTTRSFVSRIGASKQFGLINTV